MNVDESRSVDQVEEVLVIVLDAVPGPALELVHEVVHLGQKAWRRRRHVRSRLIVGEVGLRQYAWDVWEVPARWASVGADRDVQKEGELSSPRDLPEVDR